MPKSAKTTRKARQKKAKSTRSAMQLSLRRLQLRYTACISRKNHWAHKAEEVAQAYTKLMTALDHLSLT